MNKIHQKLLDSVPAYRRWHEVNGINAVHWAALIMVPILFFSSIMAGITDNVTLLGASGSAIRGGSENFAITEHAHKTRDIVRGKVEAATPFEATNSYGDEYIATQITLNVDENLKGSTNKKIKVDMVGGTIDDLTMRSSEDSTPLTPGEEAVIFLKKGSTGQYEVDGGRNGVYRIKDGKVTNDKRMNLSLDELRGAINASK